MKFQNKFRAFICHRGSLMGGHYYCFVENEGKWWCINDSNISLENIIKELSQAYIFLYR